MRFRDFDVGGARDREEVAEEEVDIYYPGKGRNR